ncbi:MAG: serine/threonine-protein phosphatase [Labilithrix sp.]|nr:serine/threonine-protein phosphatase [Labilithrix sp.]
MSRYLEPDPFPGPHPSPRPRVRVAARTDRGCERENNEDCAAFADLGTSVAFEPPAAAVLAPEPGAFVGLVCDGMGGEAGGEIASRLAVETILPFLRAARLGGAGEGRLARGLVASIEAASERIKQEGRALPRLARMGTTTTLAAIADGALVCAQVGDSRAYVLHRAALRQITRDQTMAELLRSSGAIPAGAAAHEIVGANVILQAVGCSTRLDVALTHTPLEHDDVVLLCSDGLSGVVPDAAIAATLREHADPEAAVGALVARALEAGAPDNVTCVVFRFER